MEEIDEILFVSLRQSGVALDAQASMSSLDPETFVAATGVCLRAITQDEDLPAALPDEMSGRFQVCTKLANVMMSNGFNGELGFQQFLYPDEKEVRKMLSWLVQRLPKAEDGDAGAMGSNETLFEAISDSLKAWTRAAWFPPYASSGFCHTLSTSSIYTPGAASDAAEFLPYVTDQLKPGASFAASTFEHNALEVARAAGRADSGLDDGPGERGSAVSALLKTGFKNMGSFGGNGFDDLINGLQNNGPSVSGSIFAHQTAFAQENDDDDVGGGTVAKASAGEAGETPAEAQKRKKQELQDRMDAEIEELEAQVSKLLADDEGEIREADMLAAQMKQMGANIAEAKKTAKKLEEDYKIKQRTLELLDNVDENRAQLQQICDKSAKKLIELATEWEAHRLPLLADYRKKKDAITRRKEDAKRKLQKVKEMRDEVKLMQAEHRTKDDRLKAANSELKKLPKDVKRSSYVNRILDIIKNVNKQKRQITKILEDIKSSRREINTASSRLTRSFHATDELVFADAKQKPVYKEVYKILVELHESFQKLDESITENGKCLNDIDMVQARISEMGARNESLDKNRIMKDLKAIRAENAALEKKLESLKQ